MLYNYDAEKLGQVIHDFYNATGINAIFFTEDFERVTFRNAYNTKYCATIQETYKGIEKCYCSDKNLLLKCRETREVQHRICHAGLIDVAVPVIFEKNILGYIILGQMKPEEDFNSVKNFLENCGADTKLLEKCYQDLTTYDKNKVRSVINLATMLAKHIILEDMLKPRYNSSMENAVKFIDKNFERDLSVKEISKETCLSVSALYKYFHIYFNCTPKDYINRRRVEESRRLLINTDLSVDEVACSVGFSSASYYTRIFKNIMGTTPLKFKNNNLKLKNIESKKEM